MTTQHVPVLVWPFWALWRFITFMLEAVGRLVIIVLGLVFLVIGVLLSITVVGAVIGIPVAVFGLLLISRGIF